MLIGDIINKQDAHGTTVVSCSDGAETFLTGLIQRIRTTEMKKMTKQHTVSQICNLIRFPSSSIVLILKSILQISAMKIRSCRNEQDEREVYPIVVMKLVVNESSENRSNKQLLPTPVRTKLSKALCLHKAEPTHRCPRS